MGFQTPTIKPSDIGKIKDTYNKYKEYIPTSPSGGIPTNLDIGWWLGENFFGPVAYENSKKNSEALYHFKWALDKQGIDRADSFAQVVSILKETGRLNDKDYNEAIRQAERIDRLYNEKNYDFKNDFWGALGNSLDASWAGFWDSDKEGREFLENITDKLLEGPLVNIDAIDQYIASGNANLPSTTIAYAPAPQYEDVNFEGLQFDVNPVKLWTGQELADLHNLEYDPTVYYDLIKRGTTAELERARYESALMNEASMVNDTANVTSYLDNIRNTKAEAISTGATAGAQAAAEVLQNKEAITNYATNQAALADTRFNAVDAALNADASAKINARNYFNSLAATLGQDILQLYENDSKRYGQELVTNADFYKADQELRGQRQYTNASMYGAQAAANAAIAGSKLAADSTFNEIAYLYNLNTTANGGDKIAGYLDTMAQIRANYYKYDSYPAYYNAVNNK